MYSSDHTSFLDLYSRQPFSYYINNSICKLASTSPHIAKAFTIGRSVQGIPLLAMQIGCGPVTILIHGTHHAREAITTILLLDQMNFLIDKYNDNCCVENFYIPKVLEEISFFFVPLVNPDGADLVLGNKKYEAWKANIRGVDLNENYPTTYVSDFLTEKAGPNGFPGTFPFSEPETAALKRLTECENFDGTISYHSSGEEVYWFYNQKDVKRDEAIAKAIADVTGYELLTGTAPAHGSGYKDWFIECYERPALTIEVAPYVGDKPVPASLYERVWERNKLVPLVFGNMVRAYLC